MNAVAYKRDKVPPQEWERSDMRAALAIRDISRVYRLLQKLGYSQQHIAALTGQSQPEVSAILHGRQVMAYDVLLRIAQGLGIPLEYMGLSSVGAGGAVNSDGLCVRCAAAPENPETAKEQSEENDAMYRREFIGAAAAVAVGATTPNADRWLPRTLGSAAPLPAVCRVGGSDVAQIRSTTDQLHQLHLQIGGGAARDATLSYLRYAAGLLGAQSTGTVAAQLRIALADLHNVAGETLHDAGLRRDANAHFLQGLILARDAGDRGLTAALLWQMGRVYLFQGHAPESLRLFQLAQLAAQEVASHSELARLHSNEALVYALLGQPERVADALARADHERSLVTDNEEATAFHGAAYYDSTAYGDAAHYEVKAYWILSRDSDASAASAASAERAIHAASRLTPPDVAAHRPAPCRALDQTMLAGSTLLAGERDAGITAAHSAIDQVLAVCSTRNVEELGHLAEAAKAWPRNREAVQLRRRIAAIRPA